MADDVVDVIHRIAYDIDDADLKEVQTDLQKQLSLLDKLGQKQIAIAKAYKDAGATDDATRKKTNDQLRRNAQEIANVGKELEKTILTNKSFNKAMEQEIGLINTLNYRLDVLEKRRKQATSATEVQRYNNLIKQEQAKLRQLSPGESTPKSGSALESLGGIAKFAAPILAGVSLVGFAKDIFEVTSKFESYNNVLKNTFQSSQRAGEAFKLIQDFAKATPFSVDQITASYIKLVNRGFEPTKEELTEIGDLAASQGKSFDQLVEALLDAQTGEFERLKEFGIKARTVGDTVTLSFKGIEKQVKKTDQEGLRNAILSFGKLQGVAGGMATVAQGLEGKISNLGDSFDALKANVGDKYKQFFGGLIDAGKELIDTFSELIAVSPADKLRAEQTEVNSLVIGIASLNEGNQSRADLITELNQKYPELLKNVNLETLTNQQLLDTLKGINEGYAKRIQLASVAAQKEDVNNKILENSRRLAASVSDETVQDILKRAGKLDEFIGASGDFESQLKIIQGVRKRLFTGGDPTFKPKDAIEVDAVDLGINFNAIEDVLKDQISLLPKLNAQNEIIAKQEAALIDANKKRFAELNKKVKEAGGLDKAGNVLGDFELSKALTFPEIGEFNQLRDQFRSKPLAQKPVTTPTTKKKTAADAQRELLEEFQADLRKSLIRDEVQDFIRASQDIEADRKKRLDKIEKLEREFKTKFDKARKTSDEIVAAELLRDREDYEVKRRKLIADNEQRISELIRDAELKRAQIIKNSFAIETALLDRELENQQKTVQTQREAALQKLQDDAQKGLFGNLERAKDGINLPRDSDGKIIIKFVKVDDKGNPIKNADGTFQEDIDALNSFNKEVTDTNKLYDTIQETNTATHFEKLLDIQLKYHAQAQTALVDFLQSQNVNISKEYAEQIQTITDAYLLGKISLKDYTDFVEKENKKLAKNQLQAQLENLAGADAGRGNLRSGFDISQIQGGRVGEINTILQNGGFTGKDQSGKDVFTPLDDEARNKLLKERLDLEQQILDILVKQNEQRGKDKGDAEKTKKEQLLQVVDAYQAISDAALSAAATVVSALQASVDKEIEIREKRLDKAKEIADRGNAEALEAEEARLAELQAKQERFARIQLGINNIMTLSNAIAAVARAAAEGGIFAPATIAAVIGALAAGFATVKGFSQDLPGFAEGVVDYKGAGTAKSDSNTVRISRHESVMTADATAAHRDVLEAMNRGEKFNVMQVGGLKMLVPKDNQATPITGGAAGAGFSDKKIAAKLDQVTEAVKDQAPSSFSMDRRGIVAIVKQVMSDERRRWKV